MKKRKKAAKTFVAKKALAVVAAPSPKLPVLRFGLATLAVVLFSAMGAIATNTTHHGHVAVTRDRTVANAEDHPQARQTASQKNAKSATVSSKVNPEFIAKYGLAAKSQQVAAEIMRIETAPGPTFSAVQAADAAEATRHGYWRPGASSMDAILAGYVPPGMAPEQAAMLYNALPRNARAPVMQEAMTPERIARMAGEPADPMGLSQTQIQIQNEQIARSAISERFGPIYVPPLQKNHQGSIREMTDDSGNIVAQYAYDPYGNTSKVQGTMDSDFQYAGYYIHARSGLNLTTHRAYSPVLGRFINRDPIHDLTFKLRTHSPEPRDSSFIALAAASGPGPRGVPSLALLSRDPTSRAQFRALIPGGQRAPSQMNDYAYVANNPIMWSDPSGLAIGGVCPLWNDCHPPRGLDDYTNAECYAWCKKHCQPNPWPCFAECDEWYPR